MKKKRILLVDDTPVNIKVIMAFLGDDYDYSVALDGERALSILEDTLPDLMLIDVVMPGMDGFTLCRRIKSEESLKNIPLIFITSLDADQDEKRGRELGASDFIYKPFNADRLKEAVKANLTDSGNPSE